MKIYRKGAGESIYTIVKLPCGCTSIEVIKPTDQLLICPRCKKKFYLTWTMRDQAKKIKEIEFRM